MTQRRARPDIIRVYQRLRTVHLERAHLQAPSTILYCERSYDFDDGLAQGLELVRAGTWKAPWLVLRSGPRMVEVNEPLVRHRLLRTFLCTLAARASQLLRQEKVTVVSYAIENRDPFTSGPRLGLRGKVRRAIDQLLSKRVASSLDRLVFGTAGSRDLHTHIRGLALKGTATTLIPAIPSACDCPEASAEALQQRQTGVVFVGAFDARKGVMALLAAWQHVEDLDSDLSLVLMGKGPLLHQVREAASGLQRVTLVEDPPRPIIHAALRRASVLVLLSQPAHNWREQVGLPIVEGLAHGCTIITTDQTGLAEWLEEHGHHVLEASTDPKAVAGVVVHATVDGRVPRLVTADLPSRDGRLLADEWMMS